MKTAALACALVLFLFIPATTEGQFSNSLSIEVSPSYPEPFSTVRLQASPVGNAERGMEFVWSVDGVVVERGVGQTTASFTVGRVGARHSVSLTVLENGAVRSRTSISIPITAVAMILETDTYTPPLYKGASLPVTGSVASIVAIPDILTSSGALANRSQLDYTWKYNGRVISDQSGVGENVYHLSVIPRNDIVEVEISFPGEGPIAQGRISIEPHEPELLFYVHNPLLGPVFEHAVAENFNLRESETTLGAYPYFFSTIDRRSPALSYRWTLNNSPLTVTEPNLTVRKGGSGGRATLSAEVENEGSIYERVIRALTIFLE